MKPRKGSLRDISSNYIETEHEVIAQILYDIEIAKTIKRIKDNYDISDTLKQRAKNSNYENIVGGKDNLKRLSALRAEKSEIQSAEPLDSYDKKRLREINEEIWSIDPTMPFNRKMAIGFAKLEKDYGVEEGGDFDPESADFKQIVKLANEDVVPAKTILKAISDRETFIKETLGDKYLEWKHGIDSRLIPDGYQTWQPREGNVFYMADTIPAQLAEKLVSGELERLEITAEDLQKIMAVGGRRTAFIIKNEIAETLNNLVLTKSQNTISQGHQKLIKGWKAWQLISPKRFFKFNTRNLTGDADGVFAGSPSVFLKVPEALEDLWEVFFTQRSMKGNILDYFKWVDLDRHFKSRK